MSCPTLAQLSFTGASDIASGNVEDEAATAGVEEALLPLPQLPQITTTTINTTTSSSAPGPARHELTHLPLLILGEVGLATMQDHATALLPLNGCGYCLDRHHLLSESFKACWLPWIFPTTCWSKTTQ